ncbi:acetylcholine receptor subunit delta isoform X2 [Magallana gigas]|uniref:acetylcholine receptor subunit delta isoform X2 n=1 Tax=Magallana gigas TaxID=29159 RepID=UPI003340971A
MKILGIIFCNIQMVHMFHLGQTEGKPSRPFYSLSLETDLRTELFETNQYSPLQRPVLRVTTNVSLTILTVNELAWEDNRLSWNNPSKTSQDYTNVVYLFSAAKYLWTPTIIIENSVDDVSTMADTNIPLRITSDGAVYWSLSGIFKVACESDIRYYPLDSQTCIIRITTWGYTQGEILLQLDEDKPINFDYYNQNGEWELHSSSAYYASNRYERGLSFSTLYFQMTFKRKPLFHIINTIFPVVLMAFLIPMVYKLPSESGEKMGYCLTVLLAYAVYMSIISDNIPSTSKSVCFLSIYLGLTLAFSTISVNLVILTLYAYFQGETAAPTWILTIIRRKRRCDAEENKIVPCLNEENGNIIDGKVMEITQTPEAKTLTYHDLSLMLDKFFFMVYMIAITLSTLTLLIVLLTNYHA